jgi:hypothetical protein
MKTRLLLPSILLLSTAYAADLKCPDAYPAHAASLSEVPAGHDGRGLVRGARLSGAYISVGKLFADPGGFEAMRSVPRNVKGGWDTEDRFTPQETKWLVCVYGGDGRASAENPRVAGNIEWWEKISPNIRYCALHFREVKLPSRAPSEWAATASCK